MLFALPMRAMVAPQMNARLPEARLAAFISKFDQKNQALIRATRKALRQRLPTANELVYDNYNFFVIGYSTTIRPSDCVVALVARGRRERGLVVLLSRRDAARPAERITRKRPTKPLCPAPIGGDAASGGGGGAHRRRCLTGANTAAGKRKRHVDHTFHLGKAAAEAQTGGQTDRLTVCRCAARRHAVRGAAEPARVE
jgi:hypothetical protein